MKNRINVILISAFFLILATYPLYALALDFFEEPLLSLQGSKTVGKGNIAFNLQHNFTDFKIASANLRLGYGIFDVYDIYASALFHSSEIISSGLATNVSVKEYQIENKVRLLKEEDNKILDLSLSLGGSYFQFGQKFLNAEFSDTRIYFFGNVILSKNIMNVLQINVAPVVLYDFNDKNIIMGITPCARVQYKDMIAVLLEYPVLLINPDKWSQPWSVGLQFHIGPHVITLFTGNTYGFTISNALQGLDKYFAGFRFSF